ncbi:MAG: CDP-alcohol phosphatidyltransferase family protein [Candidatus Tantalella remota]|nr:CDP-alcohol phosphatidyltransferase family protein [Candidatus Tantalella remota]
MNWANRLTICRIILVPVFIAAVLYQRLNIALVVFIVAMITDALDGYLARSRNEITRFGAIMDPISDKMLIGSAFLSFSIVQGLPVYLKMPVYVPIVIISRDVIILLGVFIIQVITGGVEIKPTLVGKITTFFQMITIIALLLRFVHSSWLWNATVALTVISGIDYVRRGSSSVNGKL